MTSTPNTTTGSATPNDPTQGIPSADAMAEASARTQADVRSAEEMVVQKLLGVDLRAIGQIESPEIAERIAQRVSAVLIHTRNRVGNIGQELRNALWQIEQRRNQPMDDQTAPDVRAAMVLEAVRQTFPADVTRELVERLWPTLYREATNANLPLDLKPNELFISEKKKGKKGTGVWLGGAPTDPGRPKKPVNVALAIDTDHPIWRNTPPDRLLDMLKGKSLVECGIRAIPDQFGRAFTLTEDEAKQILKEMSTNILRLDSTYEEPTVSNYRNRGYDFRLKIRHLLAERAQTWNVALPTEDELRDTILNDVDNWRQFVEAIPVVPAPANPPDNHTNAALRKKLAKLAHALLPTNVIGRGKTNLKRLAAEQYSLHRFSVALREGEVNPWDVATAMTMIQQRGELAASLQDQADADKQKNVIDEVNLIRHLHSLENNEIYIPNIPSIGGVVWNLASLEKEESDMLSDAEQWRNGNNAKQDSHFGKRIGPTTPVSAKNSAADLERRRSEDILPAVNTMKKAGQMLEHVANMVNQKGIPAGDVPLLDAVVTIGTVSTLKKAQYTPATNFLGIALEVRKAMPNLREEQEYRDELKTLREKSSKPPTGATAVHTIYQNYFKGRGFSERESRNAANELMARNALDGQMEEVVDDVTRRVWGEDAGQGALGESFGARLGFHMRHMNPWERRSFPRKVQHIVATVARAFNIPATGDTAHYEAANAESLMQCYYALKSLVGGSGKLALLANDPHAHAELRRVGQVLSRRHAKALLYTFKGSLPGDFGQDDKAVDTILGQPEKLKVVLRELLQGNPPEQYQAEIQRRLAHAETRYDPASSFIRRRIAGDRWSLKNELLSKDFPLSIRNIYFGKWGILGLPWRMAKTVPGAAKGTGKAVWNERKGIAVGAILGTLLLPGVGTVAGAGAGALWRKFSG